MSAFATAATEPESWNVGAIVALLVTGGVAGSVLTRVMDSFSRAATARREGYAATVANLIAWLEVPYRISRRVDDAPATLDTLAQRLHGLQESLAHDQAWVASENTATSAAYEKACTAIRAAAGPAAQDAWKRLPADKPELMNVGNLYNDRESIDGALAEYRKAIRNRFSWRRVVISPFKRLGVWRDAKRGRRDTVAAQISASKGDGSLPSQNTTP